MELTVVHTSALPSPGSLRTLLDECFADDPLDEDDWEHCLGGLHVICTSADGVLVGHAAVVQRRLLHGDRWLRTGYVEGVGVLPAVRRTGVGRALMVAVAGIIRGAYDLGALASSDEGLPFYAALGWQPWQGPTYALLDGGAQRTPSEDDCLFVLPVSVELTPTAALTCDPRPGSSW